MRDKLEITYRQENELIPYANNTRTHSREQIEKIKSSIKEYGMATPIGLHNNTIVYGHARFIALKELGYTEFPTVDLSYMTEAQMKGYIISDNRLGLDAGWDEELLKVEIEALQEMDFDIDLLGFSMDELNDLDIGLEDISYDEDKADEVPEIEENPVIKLGDLIELGHNYQHRLLCGDSTSEENIKSVLNEQKVELVLTDPPYQINNTGGGSSEMAKQITDVGEDIAFIADFNPTDFLSVLPSIFNKKMNAYIFCNKELLPDYLTWARDNGYSFNVLVWKKPNALPINAAHRPDIEYLLLLRKGAIWNHGLKNINYSRVIEASRETGLHPTMKPVEILENEMQISSNKNGLIFDFFGGSGSTLIACENQDRKCCMIELLPMYAQVIIQRYVDYTSNPMIKINGEEVDWEEYKVGKTI